MCWWWDIWIWFIIIFFICGWRPDNWVLPFKIISIRIIIRIRIWIFLIICWDGFLIWSLIISIALYLLPLNLLLFLISFFSNSYNCSIFQTIYLNLVFNSLSFQSVHLFFRHSIIIKIKLDFDFSC